MLKVQSGERHNSITDHGLPTEPISACFIQVRVGSDPQDYLIPLVIAEAWGLSQNQTLTPEQATKLGKAVKKYRAKQQARRSGKASRGLFDRPCLAPIVAAFQRLKIRHLG